MSAAIQLAAAVLILTVLYTVLRRHVPEYAPILALTGAGVLLAILAKNGGTEVVSLIKNLWLAAGEEAFTCLFKCAGILLLCDYTRAMCQDANLTSAGLCMEFGGRCLLLLTAWPIFRGVFEAIETLTR